MQRLDSKRIHGVFEKQTKMPETNTTASHRLLVQGRFRSETEAMVIAAQCGVIETNAYRVEVQGKEGSVECRLCRKERETIGHILSYCPEHVWGLIKDRHDKMVYQLTREIVRTLGLQIPPQPQRHSEAGNDINREIQDIC